jgi:hypothetical protein
MMRGAQSVDVTSLLPSTLRGGCLRLLLGLSDDVARESSVSEEGSTAASLVSLEAFGRVLEWFGPLTSADAFFDNVRVRVRVLCPC